MSCTGDKSLVKQRTSNKAEVPSPDARPLTICVIGYAKSVHVATRAKCFADMGHEVHLVTEERGRTKMDGVTEHVPGLEQTRAGILVRRLLSPVLAALGAPPLLIFQLFGLAWFLRRYRPDIVHVHYAHSQYGWCASLLGCRPLVVSVMGGDVLFNEQGTSTPNSRWLTLQLLSQADYITSKSHHLTSVLDRLGGFGQKTERIIWGVSMSKFHRTDPSLLKTRFGLGPDQRVILSPRILQPLYQVHLLVEALPHIVREVPEAVLLITEYCADPDYRARVAQRVADLGLARHVVFCGEVDHAEMPMLYGSAEISVGIPSSDGLPQSLLEAMACETPSILNRLPQYEELVRHEHSAYFVDTPPEAIAAGVIRLLRDPGLRARISRNALETVAREADLNASARRVLQRYRQLVATVPARAFSVSRLWSALRSYRRLRATLGT